jgi:hypothetical protein
MELIVMILSAFPIGYAIKNRLAAFVVYIAVHSFVFTFQTANLLIEWAGGDDAAFGPFPDASSTDVWSYAVVNLVIYLVGLGLVFLGHRIAARRSGVGAVNLDPVS